MTSEVIRRFTIINYKTDSSLSHNLYPPETRLIKQNTDLIKAVLQRFNNSLLDQKLLIR